MVAEAMSFQSGPFGTPTYFDGRTPPDWPAGLVPPGTKVIGSGEIGDTTLFRMRAAVFEFSARVDPRSAIETMLKMNGYTQLNAAGDEPAQGGFMSSPPTTITDLKYCKTATLAMFGAVDSTRAPHVFSVVLLDGEAGRQTCAPERSQTTASRFPVTVPPLVAPAGTMTVGGSGSSWNGSEGQFRSSLRTTMPADSILANYSAQLVAAGWKANGRPAITDGVGVQRFTFLEGQDQWTAVLLIMAAGDRRDVRLEVARID